MPDAAADPAADARAALRADVDKARADVAKCEKELADHEAEIAREQAAARERAAAGAKAPKASDGDDEDDDPDDGDAPDFAGQRLRDALDSAKYNLQQAEALLAAAEGTGDVAVLDDAINEAKAGIESNAAAKKQGLDWDDGSWAKRLALLQAARAGIPRTPATSLADAPDFSSGSWGAPAYPPDDASSAIDDVIAHDEPSALPWAQPATSAPAASADVTRAIDDVIAHDEPPSFGWTQPATSPPAASRATRRVLFGSLLFFGIVIVGFGIHAATSGSSTKTTPAATPATNSPSAAVTPTTISFAGAAVTLEQVSQSGCTTNVIAHAKITDPTFAGDQAVLRITGPGGGDFPFTVPAGGGFDMPFTENGCDTWNYAVVSVNGIPTAAAGGH